ncbi:MAG: DUF5611 family protein [Thermoplasmatota archaeon]
MLGTGLRGSMQEYPVKPGHAGKIDFKMIFEAAFGSYEEDDGWLKGSYGSMPKIWAKQEGKKLLVVDTETDKGIAIAIGKGGEEAEQAMALAQDTQRQWNDFLEGVTGYNAKMRSKKVQEKAKKEAKAAAEKESK